jgi:hypothetical protein
MAVQTIPISYEAIKAGNIHVNCRCEYVLLVKQADGTFLNAVDHVAKNGGPGSSNFGHGGRPGQIGGSAGKGGSGGSTRTSKPSKKTLAGPKDQALREVEENESSSPSPDELYDYMDGNLPERAGDPYDSSDYDNSFEGKNEAGRTAWINDHVMQNTESDHDEEIANYVGKKDYSAINTYLRNPEYFSHPNHKDEVARLQPLIQKVKLATQADTVQKDMSTYRAGIFTEDYVNNLRPGTYIKDAGIVSTSMSAIYSTEFGARRLSANNKKAADGEAEWMGNVLFRVNSKAGQKGIYADTRRTAGGSEFEWIPAYGSNLYVTEAVKFTDSEGRFAGAIVDVDVYQESIPQGFIQTKLFENKLALNALAKATGDEDRFVWTEEDVELWVPEEEAENKYNPSQPRDKDGQWTDGGGSSSSSMSSIRAELAEKAKKKMYDGGVDDFISNEATHYRGETVERELPETGGDLGVGYYFTDNAWLAEKYSRGSDIVKRFVVDDSKALRLDDSVSAHKELTKSWYDQYRSEIPKAYDGSEMSYDLFAKQSDSVGNFLNWVYIEANPGRTSELDDTRNRFLEKSGFTGIEYDQASVLSVSLGEDYDAKNLLMFSKDSSLNEQDLTDIYNEARSTSNNSLEDKVENYSPSQPRDADGQWTDGGSGGGFTDLSGKNSYAVAKEMGFPDGNFDENPNYSEDEKTAVRYYGRIGNEPMNDILRYGGTTDPEERLARQRLKTLVDMKKQTLSKDVTLYRGAQLDQTLDIGDSVSDRAFVSTSFDKDIAREFATEQYESGNKYLFQINAPKGAEGIFVGQGHDWDEVEWVMDRGRDFKVQSISKPDDDGLITVGVNYE